MINMNHQQNLTEITCNAQSLSHSCTFRKFVLEFIQFANFCKYLHSLCCRFYL